MKTPAFSKFVAQIEDLQTENKRIAYKHIHNVVSSLFYDIVKDTPIFTGRARSNWNIGEATRSTVDFKYGGLPRQRNQNPNGVTNETYQKARGFFHVRPTIYDIPDTIYIWNNVEYINILEFGGVGRAGNFMVTKALQKHGFY